MNDTPETDAATHDLSDYGPPVPCSWGDWVATEFARKLERERDKARVDAAQLADRLSGVELATTEELARLERERDEARAERDILRLDAQSEAEHHDRMVGELEKVYKERDEAREALDCLLAVIGLTPIAGNKKALQEAVDQCLVVLRKQEETK
jgi:hypothetical protein